MTVTGPMLCTLAQEEGKDLGLVDFKASESWLEVQSSAQDSGSVYLGGIEAGER